MFPDQKPATVDVMKLMGEIQTSDKEKLQQGNQLLLKMMSLPELLYSIAVTDVTSCRHISCVSSDLVWVSDRENLILKNTTNDTLHRVQDFCGGLYGGLHTMNSEGE